MAAHARLSASAADRWMHCPASVSLSAGLPRKFSIYAQYGTVLHGIAAHVARLAPPFRIEAMLNLLPDEVDREPVAAYIKAIERETQRTDGTWVEVTLKALKKIDQDMGGTADYIRFRPYTAELLVTDFKTGSGVDVAAEDNHQLMIYALGALLETGAKAKNVRIVVVQPRLADPEQRLKEWTFPAVRLLDFAADLRAAALATRDSDPKVVPGEQQCRFCPAGEAGLCAQRVKPRKSRTVVVAAAIADFDDLTTEKGKV
ncbi:MAG: DUF2800 domain-containing protein [Pseudomonadota bacterium]